MKTSTFLYILIFFYLLVSDFSLAKEFSFIAMGDHGTGKPGQFEVASAIEKTCKSHSCEFALLLGDNFYSYGVDSLDDPQWQTKFEIPYKNLDFPFYAVMGNHDYGKWTAEHDKRFIQMEYTNISKKWRMPHNFYTFQKGNILFIGIDTTLISWAKQRKHQGKMIEEALTNTNAKWVIAFGHHPYLSNGRHGNAGRYDGLPFPPVASGHFVKKFVEKYLCNKVDFYLAGHDHSKQLLPGNKKCKDTTFIVSGAGAKITKLKGKNPYTYQDLNKGFALFTSDGSDLNFKFINDEAKVDFETTFSK